MIELICFDLGDVLIEICQGWAEACERAGLVVDQEAFRLDVSQQQITQQAVHGHETGVISHDGFCEKLAKVLGYTPEQIDAAAMAYLKGPYPGVEQLVEAAVAGPAMTACLSNTNAPHWEAMTTPGLATTLPLDRLDYRFASQRIGERKPDAGIYQHVEQTTGIAPANILFFDNHPPNLDAAAARGWQTHLITPDPSPVEQMNRVLGDYNLLA